MRFDEKIIDILTLYELAKVGERLELVLVKIFELDVFIERT